MSRTFADVKTAVTDRLKTIGWIDGALLLAVAVFAVVQLGRGETTSAAFGLVTFVYVAELVVWKTEARKWQARYEEATKPKLTDEQEYHLHTTFSISAADTDPKKVVKLLEHQQKLADLRSLTHCNR